MSQVFKIIFIFVMFTIAFTLESIPLTENIAIYKPAWVVLVLIYCNVRFPEYVGIFAAFMVGIFLDLVNGNILGIYALILPFMTYFYLNNIRIFRNFSLLQQGIMVFISCLSIQFAVIGMLCFLNLTTGMEFFSWNILVGPLISSLLWSWFLIFI